MYFPVLVLSASALLAAEYWRNHRDGYRYDDETEVAAVIAQVAARDGMKKSSYPGAGVGINPAAIPSVASSDLQKAGYDPLGLLKFLQKMQSTEDPNSVWVLYRTHPPTADRIRLIEDQLRVLPPITAPQADTTTELKKIV